MKKLLSYFLLCMVSTSLVAVRAESQTAKTASQHAAAGQKVFLEKCMQCHSVNKDQVMVGPSLWGEMTRSPHKKTAAQIHGIILNGKGKMPPWKSVLTPQQVDDVIAFLHTL